MIELRAVDGTVLDLDNWDMGYVTTSVDLGFPAPRAVTVPRPNADGDFDLTAHAGNRAITVNVTMVDGALSRRALRDQLGRFMSAGARSTLVVATEPGAAPREITVRADPMSMVWARPGGGDATLSFKSVEPYFRGTNPLQASTPPQAPAAGRAYPLTFNRVYPFTPTALIHAVNEGTTDAPWQATILGPCTAPSLVHLDRGQSVVLSGLTLGAGEWVTVDSTARTILASGQVGASRFAALNFTLTSWFQLGPGDNRIQLRCASYGGGAALGMTWRDTFI